MSRYPTRASQFDGRVMIEECPTHRVGSHPRAPGRTVTKAPPIGKSEASRNLGLE
jgi:hypothetical protein